MAGSPGVRPSSPSLSGRTRSGVGLEELLAREAIRHTMAGDQLRADAMGAVFTKTGAGVRRHAGGAQGAGVPALRQQRLPPIPQEDYASIPVQQIGLHAGSFDFMRLSKTVEGVISNYIRVIDGYLNCAQAKSWRRRAPSSAPTSTGRSWTLAYSLTSAHPGGRGMSGDVQAGR